MRNTMLKECKEWNTHKKRSDFGITDQEDLVHNDKILWFQSSRIYLSQLMGWGILDLVLKFQERVRKLMEFDTPRLENKKMADISF